LGFELFERAAEARGRILKAERMAPANGDVDATFGQGYLLTFDVGRVWVGVELPTGRLDLSHLEVGQPVPAGLEDLIEEEPWWRVLGNPLCAAWPDAAGEGAQSAVGAAPGSVCLQFREDDQNPKLIVLTATPDRVRVSVRESVRGEQ